MKCNNCGSEEHFVRYCPKGGGKGQSQSMALPSFSGLTFGGTNGSQPAPNRPSQEVPPPWLDEGSLFDPPAQYHGFMNDGEALQHHADIYASLPVDEEQTMENDIQDPIYNADPWGSLTG